MKTRWMKSAIAMLLVMMLVVTGCGAKEGPKQAAVNAFTKSLEVNSYAFQASVNLEELELSGDEFADPTAAGILEMIKSAKLDVSGMVQQEPLQMEMKLGVEIPGDMAIKFELPIIMTDTKMYIKVPNIPMLGLPETVVGKHLEFDLEELAEQGGQSVSAMTDIQTAQKFSNEFFTEVVSKFDEKLYFSDVAAKDAGLPEGVDAKQVVKFTVTKDNFDQAATTLVKDALPALLDLMSKEEYRTYFEMEQAEIDELKKELTDSNSTLKEDLEELKKTLTVNELSILTAINKDGYPTYQKFIVDVNANDEGTDMKLKLNVSTIMSNINGTQEFSPIPTDTLTEEEFESALYGGY